MMILAGVLLYGLVAHGVADPTSDEAAFAGYIESLSSSLVAIRVTKPEYEFESPWTVRPPFLFTTSGCVLNGERILTSAHGLLPHAGIIRVMRADIGAIGVAAIERINYVLDVAVLHVETEGFFEGLVPLELAPDLPPENGTTVIIAGIPSLNGSMKVLPGETVDLVIPSHDWLPERSYPAINLITTGIEPGMSGGPVLLEGNLIAGIMLASNEDGTDCLAAPASVIRAFLSKENAADAGKSCWLGLASQTLRNADIRAWKRLKPGQTGRLVTSVREGGPASGRLLAGDVITAVDGTSVSDEGEIELAGGRRLHFNYLFHHKFAGDKVRFSLIRDGEPVEADVPAVGEGEDQFPVKDERPQFYMHAGFVFMNLTTEIAKLHSRDGVDFSNIRLVADSLNTGDDPKIVISVVLPDELTDGFENMVGQYIKSINGAEVRALADVPSAIESSTNQFLVFEFESGTVMVFEREKARAATERIAGKLELPMTEFLGRGEVVLRQEVGSPGTVRDAMPEIGKKR